MVSESAASSSTKASDWAGDYWGAWRKEIGDPVASTARWIAAQRAEEHKRRDRMFVDRFAETLAGEEGYNFRGGAAPIAVSRTRFMDDFVVDSCERFGIRQVVNLGAGMDTRAVRLPYPPHVTYYELDKPELFDVKEPLLQPMLEPQERALCSRVVIPVDFERPPPKYRNEPEAYWARLLCEQGFDPEQPSCWVLEGLTYYLPADANKAIFERIAMMTAPGSTIVFDMVNANFMAQSQGGWHLQDLQQRGCPWKWGHNDPAALLDAIGFDARVIDLRDLETSRQRNALVVHPATDPDYKRSREALTFYVTAVKR